MPRSRHTEQSNAPRINEGHVRYGRRGSGLHQSSNPLGHLLFSAANALDLVVSPAILAEYLGVLDRPELKRKFRRAVAPDSLAALACFTNAMVVDPSWIPAICRDPNDDKFLAAAVEGDVEYLVTEDADLLVLGRFEGVTILTAADLLAILGESPPP